MKNLLPCFPGAGEEVGAMLESLQWPEGYMEDFMSVQKSFLRHYAGHPEEYRTVLALSERIAALTETSSLPDEVRRGPEWTTEPMGSVFFEVMGAGMSPAQRRFFDLCQERLPAPEEGDGGAGGGPRRLEGAGGGSGPEHAAERVAGVMVLEPRLWVCPLLWATRRMRPGEDDFSYHKRSLAGGLLMVVVLTTPVELLI